MSVIYRSVPPLNQNERYNIGTLIQCAVNNEPGLAIEKGSIALSYRWHVEKTAGVPDIADQVQYDSQAGVHGLVDWVNTRVKYTNGSERLLESFQSYDRYARMYYEARQSFITQAMSNSATMELRCGVDYYTQYVLLGQSTIDTTLASPPPTATGDNDAGWVPLCAFNNSNRDIGSNEVAIMRFDVKLQDTLVPFNLPEGVASFPAGWTWYLSDVYINYRLVPLVPTKVPLVFTTVSFAQKPITSTSTTTNFSPPGLMVATASSFRQTAPRTGAVLTETQWLPGLDQVEYTISGANAYMKFPIQTYEEMVLNYILALNPNCSESNAIYGYLLDKGFGIGLQLLTPIDFTNNSLSINLKCNDDFTTSTANGSSWQMYTYFICLVQL